VQAALVQQAAIAGAAQSGASAPLTSGSPGTGPTGNPMRIPPLAGAITQGFGPTALAFEPAMRVGGISYPHFHTGLDIAAPMDTPVQAAAAGVVALAGAETDGQGHLVGYGNYVVIAHGGGMISLYGHLDKLLVKAGHAVHAGDPIGLEGSTGNPTGAHCHLRCASTASRWTHAPTCALALCSRGGQTAPGQGRVVRPMSYPGSRVRRRR
jgi:murein DD-endopeptidase MepM/ murein hydrolase activator NlpD